jgi:DNA modification methylase
MAAREPKPSPDWPADQVERRPIETLIPYARNARTHSDAQIAQIASSIREWGWTIPVLVDETGSLIAGHGRVLAARQLGIGEVPSMVARGWSDAKIRAYRLADNRLGELSGWDNELLGLELADLKLLGASDLIGFSEDEISALTITGNPGLTDPDDVPEVVEATTQPGDVWTLGRHRLVCGDATSEVDVSRCLAGVRPHLMVTDPPYGVDYDPTWRSRILHDGASRAEGIVNNDGRFNWEDAWLLAPCTVAYVWTSGRYVPESILSLESAGFERRCLIVWAKSRQVLGRGHYHSQEEECWYAVRKGHTGSWSGSRSQTTLWQIDNNRSNETGHSAQKPVECMRRPIENNSSPGQAVYDPFVGSGTTLIAAEMTGRACHAIEISPHYCDVAVERWQRFTGQTATRIEGD